MFESLIPWCTMPVMVQRRTATTMSGDITYAEPTTEMGYVVSEIQDILDKQGVKTLSTSYVYFPPTVEISEADMIQTAMDDVMCEIKKLRFFSDGNTGKRDIWVVYL